MATDWPYGFITLQGVSFVQSAGGKSVKDPPTISVLCGDTPPVITDGYAVWQTINRPLARGLPVFQGYNPTQMKLDLRFGRWDGTGSWLTGETAGGEIENDIFWLGWMAGEGFASGPPPVVYVFVYGYWSKLIPSLWQGTNAPWVVNGLEWGNAIRNNRGQRTLQDTTVTLLQFLPAQGVKTPGATTSTQSGGYFVARGSSKTARSAWDTALKIASAPSVHSPPAYHQILAGRIVNAPENKTIYQGRGSIYTPIRPGTRVFVPTHLLG